MSCVGLGDCGVKHDEHGDDERGSPEESCWEEEKEPEAFAEPYDTGDSPLTCDEEYCDDGPECSCDVYCGDHHAHDDCEDGEDSEVGVSADHPWWYGGTS